jgi:hypothetical protein
MRALLESVGENVRCLVHLGRERDDITAVVFDWSDGIVVAVNAIRHFKDDVD